MRLGLEFAALLLLTNLSVPTPHNKLVQGRGIVTVVLDCGLISIWKLMVLSAIPNNGIRWCE